MKMTNLHNLIAYRRWAPVYDETVNRLFRSGRRRALSLLSLQSGENVLIVGVGTGADFPFLPEDINATGIDLSPDMLALGFFILALALIGPALNSYISNFAGEHQGTVMGLNSASTSFGKVLGPLWGGYIYDINIQFPFFSGAATLLIGLLVSVVGWNKYVQVNPIQEHKQNIQV